MAKEKPVTTSGEHHSATPEAIHSLSIGKRKGTDEAMGAGFETPDFQRELANFISMIGDIRSKRADSSSHPLDNEER